MALTIDTLGTKILRPTTKSKRGTISSTLFFLKIEIVTLNKSWPEIQTLLQIKINEK
jgi:hypothetical protein